MAREAIKPIGKASEAILGLQPITFRYKKDLDAEGIPQFGFVAEDVAKVNPDLMVRDGEGKPYSVRYEAVNAMLLNEFLKEHRAVEELKKKIAALTATVKEQASEIQRVTAQLATGRVRPIGGRGVEKCSTISEALEVQLRVSSRAISAAVDSYLYIFSLISFAYASARPGSPKMSRFF